MSQIASLNTEYNWAQKRVRTEKYVKTQWTVRTLKTVQKKRAWNDEHTHAIVVTADNGVGTLANISIR